MPPYRIVFVCLGNICRSPIADVVMRSLLDDAGLSDQVEVLSAGTADWHVGKGADPRSLQVLSEHGYDGSAHRARQFDRAWFADHDLVVAMDRSNADYLRSIAPPEQREKVRLMMSFAQTRGDGDVPDPYYGGDDGFADVLTMVEQACGGLLEHVRTQLA